MIRRLEVKKLKDEDTRLLSEIILIQLLNSLTVKLRSFFDYVGEEVLIIVMMDENKIKIDTYLIEYEYSK